MLVCSPFYFEIITEYISMPICHCFPKDVYSEIYLQSIYILYKYVDSQMWHITI